MCKCRWRLLSRQCTLTQVVQPLQPRQAAQHSKPVLTGLCFTTGVLSQPQHLQVGQRSQVRELRERGNQIPPQVELTQRQTAGQRSQRRDAVDAEEREHHSLESHGVSESVSQWVSVESHSTACVSDPPQCQHLNVGHLREDGDLRTEYYYNTHSYATKQCALSVVVSLSTQIR